MDSQRIVILFFGVAGLCSLVGGLVLAVLDKPVPDPVISLGAAGFSALAMFLTQPKASPGEKVTIESKE